MTRLGHNAPGRPGIPPRWTSSAKTAVDSYIGIGGLGGASR
jgi:hypothetical protein